MIRARASVTGRVANPERGGTVLSRIDRSSPLPAWAQAAQYIRRQIETGRFAGGERLPSETELAEAFELSRLTVRQAMAKLADEGLVERKQGIGTFVTPRKVAVQHDLSLSSSWRQRFEEEGHASSSQLLESSLQDALPVDLTAGVVAAEVNGPFAFLKRLHYVDSQPIGATESWVPANLAPGLADSPLDEGSLSATLHNRFELSATTVDSSLEAVLATATDAQLLDTVTDVPLFVVTAVSWLKNGELLEISRTSWVGGRVRFRFLQHSQPSATADK
jgi:GntR family transcriptional regulator